MVPAAFGVTALIAIIEFSQAFTRAHFVETWQASQFWLSYADGFVRRGLPGQLLAAVTGGAPASWQVTLAAIAVAVLGAVALTALVLAVVRVADRPLRPLVAALLVCSPFTFALLVQDVGRYDAFGYAALAVVVLGSLRLPPLLGVLTSAAALLVAAAAQEVLAAFLVPVVLLGVWRALAGTAPRIRFTVGIAAILPGLVVGVWGLVHRPSTRSLLAAVDRANAARPDISRSSPVNAIAALSQDIDDALAHLGQISPWVMPFLTIVFGGCAIVTTWLIWQLTGKPQPRLLWSLTVWCALAAIGLSVIGIDYRRWWALAFVTVIGTIPLLARPNSPRSTVPSRWATNPVVLVTIIGLSAVGQEVPVGAAILLDPAAQTQILLEPPG